jgi:hypothetical protein
MFPLEVSRLVTHEGSLSRGIGTQSDMTYKPFKNGRYKFFSDDMNPLTLFLSDREYPPAEKQDLAEEKKFLRYHRRD